MSGGRKAAKRVLRFGALLAGLLVAAGLLVSFTVIDRPARVLGRQQIDQQDASTEINASLAGQGPYLDLRDGVRSGQVPPRTAVLTFDDGPSPEWTPAVQAVLDRERVPGTFFVIGEEVVRNPGLVQALDRAGHEIGNHTYTHPRLGALDPRSVDQQIALTQEAVAGAIGKMPQIFRPPYSGKGDVLPASELDAAARVARRYGVLSLLGNYSPRDFDTSLPVSELVAQALPPLGQGAVINFHDGGGNRANTVQAVAEVITILKANGYRFARASDVVGLAPGGEEASILDRARGMLLLRGRGALSLVWTMAAYIGLVLVVLTLARVVLLIALARRERADELRRRAQPPFLEPVTVVIPAHNEERCIEATVRSIAHSDHPDIEVIVIDDGSTDRTAEIVQSLGLRNVQVIRQPNSGKFFALNIGLVRARNDIVIMVDADTVFEPSTIPNLIQPFRDPDVGAVAGNAKVGNRRTLLGRLQHIEYTISSAVERRMFNRLGTMSCVPGAVGAFRRRAIFAVGGMSRETLAEDTDITMALSRAGWRVPFASDARAWTEGPSTLGGLYRQRLRWSYGILQSIAKHRRAVVEGGPSGRLGRRVIAYQLVMGYVFALAAPVIDFAVVYQLTIDGSRRVEALLMWAIVNGALIVLAGYALRLEREPLRVLWAMPFQQIVFRQVLYAAVLRSIVVAILGSRLPWHSLNREGELADLWEQTFTIREIPPPLAAPDARPEPVVRARDRVG